MQKNMKRLVGVISLSALLLAHCATAEKLVMPKTKNGAYATLGLPSSASDQAVKKAYRTLAMKYHPDKNRGNEREAQANFQAISAAYEMLEDSEPETTSRGKGRGMIEDSSNIGDLAGIYGKIAGLGDTMTQDTDKQTLSKAYGGKVDRNLGQLIADAKKAASLARKLPASSKGASSVNNGELLINVALAAVDTDTLDGFSEDARRNLRDEIGNLGSYGDLEDDANAVLDALDESLGEDSTSSNYKRKDSPAVKKVWKDRRHVAKDKRRKKSGAERSSSRSSRDDDDRSSSGKKSKQPKQTRGEKQEAEDKKRMRALAKSKPAVEVNLGETKVGKMLGSTEDDFVALTPAEEKARAAQQAKWAS